MAIVKTNPPEVSTRAYRFQLAQSIKIALGYDSSLNGCREPSEHEDDPTTGSITKIHTFRKTRE